MNSAKIGTAQDFERRVQRLHTICGATWAGIAGTLGISRTMLHYYRRGQHPPDAAALYRLTQAEASAGIGGVAGGAADEGWQELDPAADASLKSGRVRSSAEWTRHLGFLRAWRDQQRAAVAAAERHLREIDGWIRQAEDERRLSTEPTTAAAPVELSDEPLAPAALLRDIETVSLPIFGHLPAGWPQTRDGVAAQRPARWVPVTPGRFPEGAFGLEVRGESMNAARPAAIPDGTVVVLLPPEQREARHGDVVAALIDGETCLKRLVVRKGSAHLCSESTNPAFREIFPAQELLIQGVLVGRL